MALAGQAGAAIVTQLWAGSFDAGIGPNGAFNTDPVPNTERRPYAWRLDVVFDTDLGALSTTPTGQGGVNQHISGTDALISATFLAFGQSYSFDDATTFSLYRDWLGGGFDLVGSAGSIHLAMLIGASPPVGVSYLLTDPYQSISDHLGAQAQLGALSGGGFFEAVTSTVAAVPEPETWVFLIAGLAAAGSAIRRQRQVERPLTPRA